MISAPLTLVVFLRVGLRHHPKETETLLFIRHVSSNYIPGFLWVLDFSKQKYWAFLVSYASVGK